VAGMTTIKIANFSGLRPRFPDSLLPEHAATLAQNCDFAYGELRNTKDAFLVNTMSNAPRGVYTDDGLRFFTWTTDVNAVRSPLASDTFNRMYYTDSAGMKVANRSLAQTTGGPPSSFNTVGVPRPTTAPTIAVQPISIDTTLNTYTYKFHLESGGVKYQETTLTPMSATGNTITYLQPSSHPGWIDVALYDDLPRPGLPNFVYRVGDRGKNYVWGETDYTEAVNPTPEDAIGVLRVTCVKKSNNATLYDIYSTNSALYVEGSVKLDLSATGTSSFFPQFTATLSDNVSEANRETRAYIYTYVNQFNEEGPPSDPATVTTNAISTVNIGLVADNFTTSNYVTLKEIRIYRTPTGSTIADYYYTGSIFTTAAGNFTFVDNVLASELNEPLSSVSYYPPPAGLVGLMSLPNGILCAWKDNEVWFSEAYKPWAWPPAYVKTLAHRVVGGIAHGAGAVVTTVQQPYLISGVSPDSMTATRLNVAQAGVSKWSIAAVDGAVVYASNDGIVTLIGGSASMTQSEVFFTRDVWRSRYATGLSTMVFSVWDGRLVVFSSTAAFTPFMLRMDEAAGTMTDLPNLAATCAFISLLTDQFYFGYSTGIYQFNGGASLSSVWQSREVVQPAPVNYGFAQAVCEGSWSIEFWVYIYDSAGVGAWVLKHTKPVTTGVTNFRLPSGFKSDRWKIKLSGSGRFRELRAAQTAVELAKV